MHAFCFPIQQYNINYNTTSIAILQLQEEYKKFSKYALEIDSEQDDKAIEIKLCSTARPHMRAFHVSCLQYDIYTI